MGRVGRRWNLRRTTTSMRANPGVGWPSIQRALALLLKSVRNRKRFFFFFLCLFSYFIARTAKSTTSPTTMNKTCVLGIVGRFCVCAGRPFSFPVNSNSLIVIHSFFFMGVTYTPASSRELGLFCFSRSLLLSHPHIRRNTRFVDCVIKILCV